MPSLLVKLTILAPPQIFSGDIPFQDISRWSSLRSDVVKYGKRPARPQLQDDIGREFDDKLWSLIEECWSQEPSNRPTAVTISLRLGGVNGCLVNPAEMYKEIAVLTEELARVKERSKDLETELARREFEQAELKKDLDEERHLRKQVEKDAERVKAARQDLETELAKLRDSLAKRDLEQAELKKDLDGERELRKQVEKNADERSKAASQDQKPIVQVESPSIPNGIYNIKNRTENIYWAMLCSRDRTVYFWHKAIKDLDTSMDIKVNDHSNFIRIIQVLKG